MIYKVPKICKLCSAKLNLNSSFQCNNCFLYRILFSSEDDNDFIIDSDSQRITYEEITFKDIMIHAVNYYNYKYAAAVFKINKDSRIILDSRIDLPILDFSNIEKLKFKIKNIIMFS